MYVNENSREDCFVMFTPTFYFPRQILCKHVLDDHQYPVDPNHSQNNLSTWYIYPRIDIPKHTDQHKNNPIVLEYRINH
jgi:hypothetical protein